MNNKDHLTPEGLAKIKKLAFQMNKERSFEDKYNYCKLSLGLICKSNEEFEIIYDLPAHWVQTYLTGEGLFYTYVAEKKSRGIIYQGCDSSLELG